VCFLAAIVAAALLAFCYGLRPDRAAAVTLFPAWAWSLPVIVLAALTWRRVRGRPAAAALCVWVAFSLAFAEEPSSLFRGVSGALIPRPSGAPLRVVSLNCGGGLPEAAAEVEAYRPDVVLLQEVPKEAAVRAVARRLFGAEAGVCYGWDTAVLARGPITPALPARQERFFVAARVRLPAGAEAEVISLRLTPPVVRFDLWQPGCWEEQLANRRARRAEMRDIMRHLETVPPGLPLIVGGDFNAPAGDAVPRMLSPRLTDTFAQGGRGWGNTVLNDLPISRIDQVWASRAFRARRVTAHQTRHSDHRLVVADLAVTAR
jgi:endonuclease/exonuclease/phosphatase (EEP) superfamily protein YafD